MTIILSDCHLGGRCTRTSELLDFLHHLPDGDLVLNGDTLDSDSVLLPEDEFAVLERLAELSRERRVVFVKGNHDPEIGICLQLLNMSVEVVDQLIVESVGMKILVLHGHQFDPAQRWSMWSVFHGLGATLARLSSWVFGKRFGRWLRYWTSRNSADDVQNGAEVLAYSLECAVAVCGHTHKPDALPDYVNTGSWCENIEPTYAIIADGKVMLQTYKENP